MSITLHAARPGEAARLALRHGDNFLNAGRPQPRPAGHCTPMRISHPLHAHPAAR